MSNSGLTHLGDMPIATFLADYWQKRPVLIRQAFADVPVVPADELAGYSLEKEVESRILVESPTENRLRSGWKMHHGPFRESFFKKLPETHWTLLVQAVDQLHPDIYNLLHQFRFIPNWRVDDVMISYAVDGGGVGPHFDYYDVFLLQAQGTRRWKLGQTCSTASPLRKDTECKILEDFITAEEWLVEPGDLLYIPPNVSHWGIAEGECMTYSVGFRAPSHSDILLDLCQDVAGDLSADKRFADPGRALNRNPGEITPADLNQVRTIIENALLEETVIRNWFGRYMTQSRRSTLQFEAEPESGSNLKLTPQTRAAYVAIDESTATLFINGEQFTCSLALAERLCRYDVIDVDVLTDDEHELMRTLLENEWVM